MTIKWLQAVIDVPAVDFERAGDFWVAMTESHRGEVHPDYDQYVHLVPKSGDMHLELQRIDSGPARAHLDLLVDNIDAMTERAVSLGATLISQPGHAVLETPGGVPFCIVPHSGESERGPLIDAAHPDRAHPDCARPHSVDQICLDVPHQHFEADVSFWAELTGWTINPAMLPEFRSFTQPSELPLRILIQQLGADDKGRGRSHLDISSGDHVHELVEVHHAAGATVVEPHQYWTALVDPAGMPYCLTSRPPS